MQEMRHREGKLLVHSHPAGGGRGALGMKTTCLQSPPPNILLGEGEGPEDWNRVLSQDWFKTPHAPNSPENISPWAV